ncbi:hypothetical protein Y1Q_0001201 [Alligator mississippiensis]|uniref:Uncharacterized protein n=1 Tax=Alligator mississippiensis TaxID=8496 RepID=A0A151PED9_ALLMI|nr:hypothetical protein Y1Q_0001201 [Alligator mississippiensis]
MAYLHTISSSKPLELVCIDFLTIEPDRKNISNVLVVTDHFTRYAQAYPTRDQRATTVEKGSTIPIPCSNRTRCSGVVVACLQDGEGRDGLTPSEGVISSMSLLRSTVQKQLSSPLGTGTSDEVVSSVASLALISDHQLISVLYLDQLVQIPPNFHLFTHRSSQGGLSHGVWIQNQD